MTFWLDAHIDPQLALWLGVTFDVNAKHLKETGLFEEDDRTIFEAGGRFPGIVVVTKDWDFVDLVQQYGPPPQIVRLAFGNLRTTEMQARLSASFGRALELLQQGEAWVEIV